ncbi:MAG: GNAT family N-acetyltransferase [Chlamydiota bacterium]
MAAINPYKGPVDVQIRSELPFDAEITTQNLRMTPIKEDAQTIDEWADLSGDPDVMRLYMNGSLRTRDQSAGRVKVLAKRFLDGDPFSAYRVSDKTTGAFLGMVNVGHGDIPGESQMAGFGLKAFWKKGYGKEAATAMVHGLMPEVVKRGVLLEKEPLREIIATAHSENGASNRILQDLGMKYIKSANLHGGIRNYYAIQVAEMGMEKLALKQSAAPGISAPAPEKRLSCFMRICKSLQSLFRLWINWLRKACCPLGAVF